MESQQQQQQGTDTFSSSWRKGSNRIVAIHVEGEITPPHSFSVNQQTTAHNEVQQKPGWRKFTAIVGPGFLVSMAYIDPGSMETDLQTGATHRYQLLWIITMGMVFALIIQSLAVNLGVTTGKHLAEIYRAEYPKYVKYGLWLTAELAVTCADIPEVIGTAFALNILFKIPLWIGVLLTGCSTLLLLGIQRYGVRKLEFLITVLILTMAGCFFGEMSYVKPPASDLFKGMFVPKLTGASAAGDAVSNIGSIIMPHNLFLHSALVLSRKAPASVHGINDTRRYFLIETAFALFVAFLINVCLTSVTATVCFADNLSSENAERCNNLTLNSASFLLENVLGRSAKYIYGIALLASGQSSAITGTYAGQYIMQGFLDIKMKQWKRNLMTRAIAMTPSLLVAIIGGSSASGNLIIVTNMVIAFVLPFTIIPLLRFSYSSRKMGPHKNSIVIIVISWILSCGIIGINLYFLSTTFMRWLIHNSLPKVANVFIGIIVFPPMTFYGLVILYLTFRKDKAVLNRMGEDLVEQTQLEMGNGGGRYGEEESAPQ